MAEEQQFDARHELVNTLLEKVRQDPYPSTTMMDLIEQELRSPEEKQAYATILINKIQGDTFPSLDLMVRVLNAT